jgi:hypothetical protein
MKAGNVILFLLLVAASEGDRSDGGGREGGW